MSPGAPVEGMGRPLPSPGLRGGSWAGPGLCGSLSRLAPRPSTQQGS